MEVIDKTHRFVSVAFRENFTMANLPAEWGRNHVTESKESKAKDVLGGGVVFAYKFGALTFVNADPGERVAEIDTLKHQLNLDLTAKINTEEFFVHEKSDCKPRVEYNKLVIDTLTPERTAVVAQVIAQSAAMEYYELLVESVKKEVMELVDKLSDTGKIAKSPKQLYKLIGYALAIRNEVIGMMHLLDKPDLIWEDKIMDGLYDELRAVFDLEERLKALEYKLEMVHGSLDTLVGMVRDTRAHMLEWTIVILIVIEVIFTLMARFHILGW